MDKALRAEEIEGAIDGNGGWRFVAGRRDPLDEIIGADRPMGGIERFQHRPAQGRQAFAARRTAIFGSRKSCWCAGRLILGMGARAVVVMVVSHDAFYHGVPTA